MTSPAPEIAAALGLQTRREYAPNLLGRRLEIAPHIGLVAGRLQGFEITLTSLLHRCNTLKSRHLATIWRFAPEPRLLRRGNLTRKPLDTGANRPFLEEYLHVRIARHCRKDF